MYSASAATPRLGTTLPRLLLVEDEPGLAEVLALHLRWAGCDVDVAGDGLEALYALERARPDAVLLDLELPRVSGFRVLQLLKGDGATAAIPVLVLTALSFQEAREVAQAGADDFLTKPVAPRTVVARVWQLLVGAAERLPPPPGTAGRYAFPPARTWPRGPHSLGAGVPGDATAQRPPAGRIDASGSR
jgi:DNA-binding response OmpR family regulator